MFTPIVFRTTGVVFDESLVNQLNERSHYNKFLVILNQQALSYHCLTLFVIEIFSLKPL